MLEWQSIHVGSAPEVALRGAAVRTINVGRIPAGRVTQRVLHVALAAAHPHLAKHEVGEGDGRAARRHVQAVLVEACQGRWEERPPRGLRAGGVIGTHNRPD